jgi:hypothetical protein
VKFIHRLLDGRVKVATVNGIVQAIELNPVSHGVIEFGEDEMGIDGVQFQVRVSTDGNESIAKPCANKAKARLRCGSTPDATRVRDCRSAVESAFALTPS